MKRGTPADRQECARYARELRAKGCGHIFISVKVNNRLSKLTLDRKWARVADLTPREIDEAFLQAADRAPRPNDWKDDPTSAKFAREVFGEHRAAAVHGGGV